MASPSLIDLESLVAPISDEAPTGIDCRDDPSPLSLYQQVKSARSAARGAERQNISGRSNNEIDEYWRSVIEIAPKLLTSVSKDLEVCCWYSEAMLRRYGFQGLRDSFQIIDQLIEQHWDHLYPMPDEDGLETRVSSLSGLNGAGAEGVLLAPIRNTVITQGASAGPFTYWEYQQALDVQRTADLSAREDKAKKLGYSIEDVEKAVAESSNDFITDLRDDLLECISSYRSISGRLDELCGTYDAPPTSNIINTLDEICGAVTHLGQGKFPLEEATPEEEDEAAPGSAEATVSAAAGPIASKQQAYKQVQQIAEFLRKSDPSSQVSFMLEQAITADSNELAHLAREQAFKQMLEIASFFRNTEPHSPVSYILEKAVKWGKMPLHELMQELITDNSALERYTMLTGVKTED